MVLVLNYSKLSSQGCNIVLWFVCVFVDKKVLSEAEVKVKQSFD